MLPARLTLGPVTVQLDVPKTEPDDAAESSSTAYIDFDPAALAALVRNRVPVPATVADLPDFWQSVAHLLVERFRCGTSQVLLFDDGNWERAAVSGSAVRLNPSLHMLRAMREGKQTVNSLAGMNDLADASLAEVECALAVPLVNSQGAVVGAFYCQFSPFASPHLALPVEPANRQLMEALARWAIEAWERVTSPPPAAPPAAPTRSNRGPAPPLTVRDSAFSSDTVVLHFPAPIALAHRRFFQQREPRARLDRLFLALEATLRYLTTIGLADLFACLAGQNGPAAVLPDHPALDFLRRPTNLTLGKWLDALRATAAALAQQPNRFLAELPEVCAAGGPLDADVIGPLVQERNRVIHADGSLALSEDECRDLVRQLRPQVEEALRLIRFVRRYPLGFVAPFPHSKPVGINRYFVHSCMGGRVATDEQASLVETTATLTAEVPLLVAPTGHSILYLWPLWAQRKADSTQQPTLYGFDEIAGKAGQFLTRVRRSAIDIRDPWEEQLQPDRAASHDWLWNRLRQLPAVQPLPAELNLAAKLQSSQGGRLVGQTLGSNELLALVASGGFGTVYEARTGTGERVAVKVLESRETLRQYARFQREFQKLQALGDCDGIVRCFESGDCLVEERIVYWYSMEFADGGDLAGWIAAKAQALGGRLLWDDEPQRGELIAQFQSVAAAVARLHEAGLVHRDIKPSNVLVRDDGRLCLSDFGLAKGLDESGLSLLTSTGAALGTPIYMSPEQEQGREANKPADVYSLGILLAELVTGLRPEPNTKLRKGSSLRRWRPLLQLPPKLSAFIHRCTDIAPAQRPLTLTPWSRSLLPPRPPLPSEGSL